MNVGLTHLRALAIILVFLYHYRLFAHPTWIERVGSFGWTGVDLFFVLSGFLISRQLFRSIATTGTFSLRQFYFKRALRILPAYLVVLAGYFSGPWFHERESLPPLWKLLTFTQNFALDLRVAGTFSHAWSLCIEEQFYLLLPLILLALVASRAMKKSSFLLLALFAAGCLIRAWCFTTRVAPLQGSDDFTFAWYQWIYYPTWGRLDGLLVGIAIAALCEFRPALRDAIASQGNRILFFAAVLLAVAYWRFDDAESFAGSVVAFPLIALGYGALVLAALSPACALARFSSRISHGLAALSYAIYLIHKACIHIAQERLTKLGMDAGGTAMFGCCVAASVAGALLLHVVVERPFMRWRDRVLT